MQEIQLLKQSLKEKDLEKIRQILNGPKSKEIVQHVDGQMQTPLFYAAMAEDEQFSLAVINLMLEKGANPYHREENHETVIFYLASQGRAKTIEKLLSTYKFDLNEEDKYNQTPLYWAAKYNRLKVAEILIKYGVNINHLDNLSQTCLFFAAAEGKLQMCKFLVNRGCNPQHVDQIKKTPAIFAKEKKHMHVLEYFNNLKQQFKKSKVSNKVVQSKGQKKKKKEVNRNDYILVYTDEDGNTHELTTEELEKFRSSCQENQRLHELMLNPDQLEIVDVKAEKKFMKIALKVINSLLKRQDIDFFHVAVDVNIYTTYLNIISRPMDFSLIKTKLQYNCYEEEQQFKGDVHLVFDNCILFNGPESYIGKMSQQLKLEFNQLYRKESMIL